jgi:hypothetical protein
LVGHEAQLQPEQGADGHDDERNVDAEIEEDADDRHRRQFGQPLDQRIGIEQAEHEFAFVLGEALAVELVLQPPEPLGDEVAQGEHSEVEDEEGDRRQLVERQQPDIGIEQRQGHHAPDQQIAVGGAEAGEKQVDRAGDQSEGGGPQLVHSIVDGAPQHLDAPVRLDFHSIRRSGHGLRHVLSSGVPIGAP